MKAHWTRLAGKFDALSQRERALVTTGLIAVTVYMSYFLLIAPLAAAKLPIAQAIKQERAMLKAVEGIITPQVGEGPADDAVKRAYQEALRKQLADLDETLKGMRQGLVSPGEMANLLKGAIVRVAGVEFVSLRKLPVARVKSPKSVAAATVPAAGSTAKGTIAPLPETGNVYQHGFEITVQGSYDGMHDYLARLEKLPWRIFWERLILNAERYPTITLTMVVYTMSLDQTWLTI